MDHRGVLSSCLAMLCNFSSSHVRCIPFHFPTPARFSIFFFVCSLFCKRRYAFHDPRAPFSKYAAGQEWIQRATDDNSKLVTPLHLDLDRSKEAILDPSLQGETLLLIEASEGDFRKGMLGTHPHECNACVQQAHVWTSPLDDMSRSSRLLLAHTVYHRQYKNLVSTYPRALTQQQFLYFIVLKFYFDPSPRIMYAVPSI